MRVIEVSMERRNEGVREMGDPRENPPTNSICSLDREQRVPATVDRSPLLCRTRVSCRGLVSTLCVPYQAVITRPEACEILLTSRGAVGCCAARLRCGRFWVRILDKAWVSVYVRSRLAQEWLCAARYLTFTTHRESCLKHEADFPLDACAVPEGPIWAALNNEVLRVDEGEMRREWSSAGMQGRATPMPSEKCAADCCFCDSSWERSTVYDQPGNQLEKVRAPTKNRSRKLTIEMSMEDRRCERAGETGDPRENPPTSGIVRRDSHMRKSGRLAPNFAHALPGIRAQNLLHPRPASGAPTAQSGHYLIISCAKGAKDISSTTAGAKLVEIHSGKGKERGGDLYLSEVIGVEIRCVWSRGRSEMSQGTTVNMAMTATYPTRENLDLTHLNQTSILPGASRRGRGSLVVRLLASHTVGIKSSILRKLADIPFPRPLHFGAAPYSPQLALIGSQDLDVKSRPNIFTLSLKVFNQTSAQFVRVRRESLTIEYDDTSTAVPGYPIACGTILLAVTPYDVRPGTDTSPRLRSTGRVD
ncbi:hypothetical protein PR048_016617 [Dryococelus australis]|uniref:Uncharacterized protein n=1 Tax=Dryococelus australis TaxID=614101 RepID=A0ABQ9H7A8_9NEOP|nr:hypothetical protein PR048_016617 [Dryococelus australis]